MTKRDERFDAEQMDLFRQGKPVDSNWFQDWLKRQVGEHPEMPLATEALLSFDSGELSEAEVEQRFDLFIQDVQQRAHGASDEILAALTDQVVVAEAQVKKTLSDIRLSVRFAPNLSLCTVPRLGEYALLFVLPKKARETLPADLAQEFHEVIVPKMGLRLARIWYWTQVVRAVPRVWWIAVAALLRAKFGF